MAVLTNTDYLWMKQYAATKPNTILQTVKTWGLSKQDWKDALQAIEDGEVTYFSSVPLTSLETDIEVITGAATNTQRKHALAMWAAWSGKDLT